MKSISLCVAFLVVSFLFAQPGFAQKKKTSGKKAVVITQGAQIYEKPDFDANVIGTVQAGKSVVVSSGTYGAFVKFYKIRVGKTLGYIADIDVKVAGKSAAGKSAKTKTQSSEKKPSKKSAERERKEPKPEPLYFSRFIGLDVGKIWFKEGISGIDAKEGLLTYGLRVTGPDVLLEGAILDWNLILHYGAPSYYDQLSVTKPAGFVLWTDAHFMLPLKASQDSMFYFGVGPLLVYSSFKVTNGDRAMDLSALNLGLSLALGGAARFDKVVVRAEGKYFYEKQSYPGVQLSLQTPL